MDLFDVGRLVLVISTPTLLGALAVTAPRWCGAIARAWPERHSRDPKPVGPPIEQLAMDLRRLLRLHGELSATSHLGIRAHRVWAIEAAIGVRAVEAAVALGVPHRSPERPGALSREELCALLYALGDAGLVLPAKVGPFTSDGHF